MNKYEKNIKLYTFYSIFTGKLFIGTTQILFLTFKGLNFTQIMLISSITTFLSILIEVPSGMLADKIGYKKCICVGLLLIIAGFPVIILSHNFNLIIVYGILNAIGGSTISGADVSLLYESLKKLNKEDEFKATLRKIGSIKMAFISVVTIFSGILYSINEYLPYICTGIIYCLAFIVSFFFSDLENTEEKENYKFRDYFILSFNFIKKDKTIKWLLFVSSIFTVFFINQNTLLQRYMIDINFKVSLFGIVFFIYNIITAIALKHSGKIEDKLGKYTKIVLMGLIVVCFVTAGLLHNIAGIVILALCRISVATINPIIDTQINQAIESRNRATLLSFSNVIINITDAVASPIIGLGIDKLGIFIMYILLGIIGLIFIIFLFFERGIIFKIKWRWRVIISIEEIIKVVCMKCDVN